MDTPLMDAARSGDVGELNSILERDPLVLQRVSLAPTANTPLHVATLAGKTEFVKEIVRLEPSFAWEVNEEGLSPLHIASGTGHGDIMKELLAVSPDLCFIKDNGGRTPLHYAAMKGRARVIPDLQAKCPNASKEVTSKGETVFHLAVNNNHYNAVKVLMEELGDDARGLLKAKDHEGNSVMHIASSRGQAHMVKLISGKQSSEENKDVGDEGFMNFSSLDGEGANNNNNNNNMKSKNDEEMGMMETMSQTTNRTEKQMQEPAEAIFQNMSRRLDEMAPIVASLISSVTYSAGLSPPKTLWKENMRLDPECIGQMYGSTSPTPKFSDPSQLCPSRLFLAFICFNTAGFLSAILLIFLYRNTQVARLLLSTALIFMTMTYLSLTITMAPHVLSLLIILGSTVCAFAMVFIFVALFRTIIKILVRLIVFIMKKLGVL